MYVVVAARAIPDHLHGYLSRFLSEVDVGLYLGVVSPVVADRLWARCVEANTSGALTMIISDNTREQGFAIRSSGDPQRQVTDHEGVWLARRVAPVVSAPDGSV